MGEIVGHGPMLCLLILLLGWLVYLFVKSKTRFIANGLSRKLLISMFTTLLTLGILMIFSNYYVYKGIGHQPNIYRHGDRSQLAVSLTFDDGPHPIYTSLILDILKDYDVQATFFVVGQHALDYPDITKRIVDEGHTIGNHTYTHINIPTASLATLTKEVFMTNAVIYDLTGVYPEYIRPPRGMYDNRLGKLAHLGNQEIVLWSISSQDWKPNTTPTEITRRALSAVRPGDILLFHDSGALVSSSGASRMATVEALPGIIEGLQKDGYKIVPLAELLESE